MEVNINYDIMQAEQPLLPPLNPSNRIGGYVVIQPPAEVGRFHEIRKLVHRLGGKRENGGGIRAAEPNLKSTVEPRLLEVEPEPG